jgi:hypothetical protein
MSGRIAYACIAEYNGFADFLDSTDYPSDDNSIGAVSIFAGAMQKACSAKMRLAL